jgi:glycosyltransferase involved in cell wall biosynthesis
MLNIAFEMMGGDMWRAGTTILRNQVDAISRTYGDQIGTYLVTSSRDRRDILDYASSLPANGNILVDSPMRWSAPWLLNLTSKGLFSIDLSTSGVLKKRAIDVYCGMTCVNRFRGIPTLSWIADFQHVHIPDMFSESERRSRDRLFRLTAERSARILLFSEEAKKDFESFVPEFAYKVRVLNPVSCVPEWVYETDPRSILELYHLPEKFIYFPSQFWKHKNHQMLFRAIDLLKRQGGPKVIVVCNGYPGDYRHLRYFADLWQDLCKFDIRDQVIYVGLAPHDHGYLLIRQSVCVVNPSLFEGWGLTVDEARSVGKKVLLSDIPAHHEQNVPKSIFFDATDHADLASKLAEVWENAIPGPDLEAESEARRTLGGRIKAHAELFVGIVREVVGR